MITNATDYQYVSPVGIIDGGILPAREVAADGSALALRAEDLDFALEAAHERSNIYRDWPPSLPSPTFVIKAPKLSPIADAWRVIQSSLYCDTKVLPGEGTDTTPVACIDPTAAFPGIDPVEYNYNPDTWYGGNPTFADLYPHTRIFSGYYLPDGGRTLNHDYLRHFYYSLQRSERLWLDGDISRVCKSLGTISGTDSRKHQYTNTYTGTNGFGSITSESGIRYESDGNLRRRYTYGVTSASVTCIPSMGSCVAAAKVIVVSQAHIYYGTYPNKYYYYSAAHDCQINNGIEIPAEVFLTNPLAVANKLGVEFPEVSSEYLTDRLDIKIIAWYFVVWYNFRTEIRSLGWRWQPQN